MAVRRGACGRWASSLVGTRLALERLTSVEIRPFGERASLLANGFLRGQFLRELDELLPKFIHTG